MATRPSLHQAVAGQKSKASEYNENFTLLMGYVETSLSEQDTEVSNVLSVYQTVNTLATSGTIALTDNSINKVTPTGNITFTLPSITGNGTGKFHQILVQINMSTLYTISVGTNYYFKYNKPVFPSTGQYDLIYEYDNSTSHWVAGVAPKGS